MSDGTPIPVFCDRCKKCFGSTWERDRPVSGVFCDPCLREVAEERHKEIDRLRAELDRDWTAFKTLGNMGRGEVMIGDEYIPAHTYAEEQAVRLAEFKPEGRQAAEDEARRTSLTFPCPKCRRPTGLPFGVVETSDRVMCPRCGEVIKDRHNPVDNSPRLRLIAPVKRGPTMGKPKWKA